MEEKNNMELQGESKTAIGVLCGLFLGLIGLVIGLLLYKEGTYERKTFMKAWIISFVSCIAVGAVIGLIIFFVGMSAVTPYLMLGL